MKKKSLSILPAIIFLITFALGTHIVLAQTITQNIMENLSREDFIQYLIKADNAQKPRQLTNANISSFDGGWERVAKDGFGNLNNEYAWGMATYTDPDGTEWLYVGTMNMNATISGVAEVYRSSDGKNWDFVTSFPGCTGVRGITEYAGLLWLGTLNPNGCQIWVTEGTNWKQANQNGFGIGARSTRGITAYNNNLYADAGQLLNNESARIFKYTETTVEGEGLNSINPVSWEDVTPTWDNPIDSVGEMVEFQGNLYAGTWAVSIVGGASAASGCEVWCYTPSASPGWARVNEPGFGDPKNGAVLSMTVFKDKLYAGTQNFSLPQGGVEDIVNLADGAEVWRWDGSNWECVVANGNPGGGGERIDNMYIWHMIEYDGQLIIGTMNLLIGGELWASDTGDAESFKLINDPGMRRDTRGVPICPELSGLDYRLNLSEQYGIRTIAEFKNKLYVGTASWAYFVDWIIFSPPNHPLRPGFSLGCPDAVPGPFGLYMHSPNVGCEIWRIGGKGPQETLPIGAYPNPCDLSKNQEVLIDRLPPDAKVFIYTVSGELVRTLEPLWPYVDRVTWNCKNESGKLVARGIYIILVTSPTETKTGKIAIIK